MADNSSIKVNEPQLERTSPTTKMDEYYEEKNQEVSVMLRHSNDLVDKYKQLLSVKERELKRRDKKIEHSKMAMQRMSQRIKDL